MRLCSRTHSEWTLASQGCMLARTSPAIEEGSGQRNGFGLVCLDSRRDINP